MLAYRSWLSLTSLRLPNSASASSNISSDPPSSAASKTRRRFCSVSPMYLLTTPARSIRYMSSSQLVGDHLGGEGLPGARAAGEQRGDRAAAGDPLGQSPGRSTGRAAADLIDDVAEQRELGVGQHEVVPAGDRLDPLGQCVQPRVASGRGRRPTGRGRLRRSARPGSMTSAITCWLRSNSEAQPLSGCRLVGSSYCHSASCSSGGRPRGVDDAQPPGRAAAGAPGSPPARGPRTSSQQRVEPRRSPPREASAVSA